MNVLDLFSGIGGFSLGLERAGFKTAAFCEIDPFCRQVLNKHWPEVPVYDDVRTLSADRLRADGIAVDVICGGFPCQDISFAGKGAGLAGERSGLWREYARLIGELRPRFVLVENVAALLARGLGDVLGDLAALGYDTEWHCIPASAVGAPHRRDRVWVVAYADRQPAERSERSCAAQRGEAAAPARAMVAWDAGGCGSRLRESDVADAVCPRRPLGLPAAGHGQEGHAKILDYCRDRLDGRAGRGAWELEPDVGRVAHGIPARVDRLRALGNAVVPQIPEMIGRAIMASKP